MFGFLVLVLVSSSVEADVDGRVVKEIASESSVETSDVAFASSLVDVGADVVIDARLSVVNSVVLDFLGLLSLPSVSVVGTGIKDVA